MDPITMAAASYGIGILGNALSNKFSGRTKFDMLNPADYKNEIVMDDGDIGRIRAQHMNRLGMFQGKANADVKQAGAAGRLPEGAVLSGIGGVAQRTAEGASQIEPALQAQKRASILDYVDRQQRYDAARMSHKQGQAAQDASFYQGSLGGLAKMAILWKAGLLNGPGGNAAASPGVAYSDGAQMLTDGSVVNPTPPYVGNPYELSIFGG